MKKNIALFGFMGTGKTTVARLLAKELNWMFIDMDEQIEQREYCSISDIFSTRGEDGFRQIEHSLIQELVCGQHQVISTGGGVPLNPDNMNMLSSKAFCVCLTADAETILKRIASETHRPLLQQRNKKSRIKKLLEEREAVYSKIPHQIDTKDITPAAVAKQIVDLFKTNKK